MSRATRIVLRAATMASDMAAVWSRSGLVLIAILIAGAAIRLAAIAAGPGYPFDVVTFQRWAARMAAGGPASFYDPALFADYPPGLLYLLWPLGALPGGPPPEIVRDATSAHPFSSLFAFNVWALVTGFAVPDDTTILGLPARVWGLGLVAIAFALVWARTATLAASGRGPFPDELALLLAMTTLATLALYELPTRIHERYLLPAVALLVPFAFASRRAAFAYVVFSVVLAVSVLFAFTHQEQTGVRATPVLERT